MVDGVFYFGCHREAGHYLWRPGPSLASRRLPDDFPVDGPRVLDGGLLPPNQPETEGAVTHLWLNGWTILTFWDRSVDKRGKCNSSFLARGTYSFDAAKRLFEEQFPEIVSRFKFPLVLRA